MTIQGGLRWCVYSTSCHHSPLNVNLLNYAPVDRRSHFTTAFCKSDVFILFFMWLQMKIIDDVYDVSGRRDADCKLELSPAELAAAVGTGCVESLQQTFEAAGGRVNSIQLRRVAVRGQAIPFHLDHPTVWTMQVALNAEAEYDGGRLAFLTELGLEVPARPVGSATIHNDTVVHGVTEMVNGVRYSLFFLQLRGEQ
eukprot:SAG22_NODE_557_length_9118_cov_9.050006_7_plen_197_part_00